jgi:hypothetical protein
MSVLCYTSRSSYEGQSRLFDECFVARSFKNIMHHYDIMITMVKPMPNQVAAELGFITVLIKDLCRSPFCFLIHKHEQGRLSGEWLHVYTRY